VTKVRVTTQSAVSTSTSDAPIVNSVAMRDTGVILEVTPRVNKNGLVQLDISQELSNSIPTTTSNIDSPTIQERRFSSTVVVKNGDTVALGGLITENVTKSRSGVPYLSKVPLLGGLFRDTHDTKTRTELILLITPRVMRDDAEFQDVMDDLRNEFQALSEWIGRLTGDVGRPMLTMRWDQGRQRASCSNSASAVLTCDTGSTIPCPTTPPANRG
jgi:general secretion pathway protein D